MDNRKRVVITGMGVISPNGTGLEAFTSALKDGRSGISFIPESEELGMSCHVGGIPTLSESYIGSFLPSYMLNRMESSTLLYGVLAGLEAWKHAGFSINEEVDWNAGVIMGAQASDGGVAKSVVSNVFYKKSIRNLSGRTAEQTMTSSLSAYLAGYFGLGNCSITNSAACATGTEAIYMAYKRIKNGEATCILAGSSEGNSPFGWSVLDKIRALTSESNHDPKGASKPMSAFASGFVPSCGAAALVLEDMESALRRGVPIYAEIVGGGNNCGAQRNGGSMTKPNSVGIKRCIESAVSEAGITSDEIDLISGHLTATYADPIEIRAWSEALSVSPHEFPFINSLKSMTGHCLGAAGAIESVAVVSQLSEGFIHPSINCESIHPEVLKYLRADRIPQKAYSKALSYVAKANFGFGDVNTCLIFKSFQ